MDNSSETHAEQWVTERVCALNGSRAWRPDTEQGLRRLKQLRTVQVARRRRSAWTAATALIACTAALALPSTRALAQRCAGACTEAGMWIWQGLLNSPPRAAEGGGEMASDFALAPDFTLKDASGQSVRLSDFRGSVVLLNFWATWCPPCRAEIPWFAEFQQTWGDRGLVVVGVSLDADGWTTVKPFVEANRINYRVVIGNDNIAARFGGVDSLPATFLIDRHGRIAARYTGLVSKSDYRSAIESLVDEARLRSR